MTNPEPLKEKDIIGYVPHEERGVIHYLKLRSAVEWLIMKKIKLFREKYICFKKEDFDEAFEGIMKTEEEIIKERIKEVNEGKVISTKEVRERLFGKQKEDDKDEN